MNSRNFIELSQKQFWKWKWKCLRAFLICGRVYLEGRGWCRSFLNNQRWLQRLALICWPFTAELQKIDSMKTASVCFVFRETHLGPELGRQLPPIMRRLLVFFFVRCHRYTVSKPVSPTKRCLFLVCLFVEISNFSRSSIAAATAACHASAVVLLFLATRYQCVKNVETAICTWGKHTLASSWSIATFLWLHKKGEQRKWELGTTNWRKNVLLVIRKESEWAHTRNRHEVWWEYSQERRIQVHQEIATTVRKVGVLF